MRMVKNITLLALLSSIMTAGIGFHMASNYTDLDGTVDVGSSWGVTYDLSNKTSVGWDSALGLLMYFDVAGNVNLRLGWTAATGDGSGTDADNQVAETSVGLGVNWWSGGEGLKTSIGTNFDYVMAPGGGDPSEQEENATNLSISISFGF